MCKSKYKKRLINIEIITTRLDSGENLSVLINKNNKQILPLTLLFSINRRYYCQSSTLKSIIQSLKYLYNYAIEVDFDIDFVLLESSQASINSLIEFIKTLFQYMQIESGSENDVINRYSRLEPDTFNLYWGHIREFVIFWIEKNYKRKQIEDNNFSVDRIKFQLNKLKINFDQYLNHKSRRQEVNILKKDQIQKLIEVFHPSNSIFMTETTKYRNWAIFLLLIDSGIRKGELLNLQLKQLPQAPESILQIVRNPDNVNDPRIDRPRVKSYGRDLSINKVTIYWIQYYIMHFRYDYANLPYVFLNENCDKPLAIQSLNSVFKKASNLIGFKVSPHMLRHTRHYFRLKELGWDDGKEIVRLEGGWSPVAGIPETYRRQYEIEESNKTAPFFLDKLLSTQE